MYNCKYMFEFTYLAKKIYSNEKVSALKMRKIRHLILFPCIIYRANLVSQKFRRKEREYKSRESVKRLSFSLYLESQIYFVNILACVPTLFTCLTFCFSLALNFLKSPYQTEAQKCSSAILTNIFVSASKGVLKF